MKPSPRKFALATSSVLLAMASAVHADGDLDYTFRYGGQMLFPLPSVSDNATYSACSASDVAVQPDGKTLILGNCALGYAANGTSYDYTYDPFATVLRLNVDGTLDTNFGNKPWPGSDIYPAIPGYQFIDLQGPLRDAVSLALRNDGRMVISGTLVDTARYSAQSLAVVQLMPDGSFDTNFGAGAISVQALAVQLADDNVMRASALDAAGDIVVAGKHYLGSAQTNANSDFLIGRIAKGGGAAQLNSVAIDLGADLADSINALAIDNAGRYLIAGTVDIAAGYSGCELLRIDPATLLPDPTFGAQGKQLVVFQPGDSFDNCTALAVRSDGKILVAANTSAGAAIAQLTDDGARDAAFGTRYLKAPLPDFAHVSRLLVQPWNGNIVVVGSVASPDCGNCATDFAITRMHADGTLDTSLTTTTPGSGFGSVFVDFGMQQPFDNGFTHIDNASAAAFFGRALVVAGNGVRNSPTAYPGFAITRLSADEVFRASFDAPAQGISCRKQSVPASGFAAQLATAFNASPVCIPPTNINLGGYGTVSACAQSTCTSGASGCNAVLRAQPGSSTFAPGEGSSIDIASMPLQLDPFDVPLQFTVPVLGTQNCSATLSGTTFTLDATIALATDHQWGGFADTVTNTQVSDLTTSASGCSSYAGLINALLPQYALMLSQYLQSATAQQLPGAAAGADICGQ